MFCHYVATGRVLRQRISEEILERIIERGARKLGRAPGEVLDELDRIGKRFFVEGAPLRRSCDRLVLAELADFPLLEPRQNQLLLVFRRYVRTSSFLVRFFPLHGGDLTEQDMEAAMDAPDHSGLTLRKLLRQFFNFLVQRCSAHERERYIEAIVGIQTGFIRTVDVEKAFSADELQGEGPERLLPTVRLVNGSTKPETRRKLMLAFNTPFYPEILVASSVLAEGVDLHLNCRYVIHHDLCWNPSTLEQRTGRVDRIGAKCESCGEAIEVYLPYIAETQDEKMYRVVMDRERWFNVVMGETYSFDLAATEKMVERVPLPLGAVEELVFKLDLRGDGD